MKKVAILMPVADVVYPVTLQSIVSVVAYSIKEGIDIGHFALTQRTLVDTARNNLAREFLKTDNEWAMWFDADMTFPKNTITKLLRVAEDKKAKMVTGVYYQRGGNHYPVVWVRDPKTKKKVIHEDVKYDQNKYIGMYAMPGPEAKEPFKANTAGFGCALIHRSVFEVTEYPWFQFVPGKCSEDFFFFVNAKDKGFELWADPTLDLKHIADPQLIGREDCYKKMEENNAEVEPIIEEAE